ncbi:MAG: DUF748 domain-containing protein [Breznakibacter sp.]
MKKRYIIAAAIGVSLFAILFFMSSFIKNYVNKHGKELTGRRVHIEELHLNYLRTSVQIKGFAMYEQSDIDTFASFNELYINFDPWALLANEYAFSEIRLASPHVHIETDGEHFNFDDLLATEDSAQTEPADTTSSDVRFTLRNIKLTDGFLRYNDKLVDSQVALRNLNLDIPLIAWNSNQSDVGVNFRIGDKGEVTLGATVNNQQQTYAVTASTRHIDLAMLTNYTKDYLAIDSLNGYLSSDIVLQGRTDDVTMINISGSVAVDSLRMTDQTRSPILTAQRISTHIKDIDLKKFHFAFSDITAHKVMLSAILDRQGSNIGTFIAPYLKADSLAMLQTDSTVVETGTPLTYQIDTIRMDGSTLAFRDNTLNRPFGYELRQIRMTMAGLTESATNVPIAFDMNLNGQGTLKGDYVLNMQNPMAINARMKIHQMVLESFSPYSEYYIASPMLDGRLSYDIALKMSETVLDNQNHVHIQDLKFGKRTKDSTAVKVPIRLALYIIKDKDNKIVFDLPVAGNPSEPQFSLKKLIWKTVGNFFEKVATEPFNAMSSLVNANPADIEKIVYEPGSDSLSNESLKTVALLAKLMRQKPDLKFTFIQYANPELEKELIAVKLSKEQFIRFRTPGLDTAQIIETAAKLSLKNNDFEAFMVSKVANAASNTMEQNCISLIGNEALERELGQKMQSRNLSLNAAFTHTEQIAPEAFVIETANLKNVADELKTPAFRVKVSLNE